MDREALQAFLERDRTAVDAIKRAHHVHRFAVAGPASGLALSATLREWMRRVRPDWPTPRERADDLAHHVALKALLDRCADAFTTG